MTSKNPKVKDHLRTIKKLKTKLREINKKVRVIEYDIKEECKKLEALRNDLCAQRGDPSTKSSFHFAQREDKTERIPQQCD